MLIVNQIQKNIILNFSAIKMTVQVSHTAGNQSEVKAIKSLWKM